MIAALIVAAGRGTRAALDGAAPKQYVPLAGRPILERTIAAFQSAPEVATIQVVIHPDDNLLYRSCVAEDASKLRPPVTGGASRQESARLGLEALANVAPDIVLIHDAARPFVDQATIAAVISAARQSGGAIAALPATDTLKRQRTNADAIPTIESTVDRAGVWRALTPQAFDFTRIYHAHAELAQAGNHNFTDDAAIAEHVGLPVALVHGNATNIKITTPGDFAVAESYLRPPAPDVRTGQGFDVHAFTAGDHVTLCGIDIAHNNGLRGHSDADVAMHALTDALYGAIADGDIGQHFPPTDDQWRGAASHIFLDHAAQRVAARGGTITNIDVTIICESPKIGPHRDAMRTRLAEITGLDISRIAVKATTSEQLGFTGRREGIATLATATVIIAPSSDPT